jgi:hypothetical protein
MNCKACHTLLPDLLLDPTAPSSAAARTHLESCAVCSEEFRSVQATFNLLDAWQAPEPSAYFDQKLSVRLREAQAAPPAGWLERLRIQLQLNTGRQFRPALVGALALAIIVGGGTAANLTTHRSASTSATVNDLQILDKNAQALQTMDQLLQDDTSNDDSAAPPLT